MKKNLISVLILALCFANLVLTALLIFTIIPETKKANNLIDQVCQAISLDLNSLKHVNDTYGHAAGDEMICAAVACMMSSFGEFGRVYRIGGDEFAVIITQKPDELDAMKNEFDSSVAEWRGKLVDSMTISYGCVSSLEEDWEHVYDIAKEADRRMYASKSRYYSDSGIDRRK